MARCPGCGSDVKAPARFCSLCGASVAPPAAAPASTPPRALAPPSAYAPTGARGLSEPAYAGPNAGRGKVVAALAAGLLVVCLAAFLLARAAGLLNAGRPQVGGGGVLNAPPPTSAPAPVLNAPRVETPKNGVIAPPATQGNPMPADVIAYLRWLKQYEAARNSMEKEHAAVLMTGITKITKDYFESAIKLSDPDANPEPPAPQNNVAVDVGKILQQWNQAVALFTQKTPPDVCAPLAANYNGALSGSVAEMSKLGQILSTAQKARVTGQSPPMDLLNDLNRQKTTRETSRGVDATYEGANQALNNLRARYTDIPADINASAFTIQAEQMPAMDIPRVPGQPGG